MRSLQASPTDVALLAEFSARRAEPSRQLLSTLIVPVINYRTVNTAGGFGAGVSWLSDAVE